MDTATDDAHDETDGLSPPNEPIYHIATLVERLQQDAAMSAIVTKLTDEQVASFAIAAPTTPTEDVYRRLLEHGLSRGGRPRKTGRATQPVSGPVTLAELGFKKGFLARCQKLAAIPETDFEELLAAYRLEGKKPTASGILRTWYQRPKRSRPASLERMASLLRAAGWTVIPPP